MHLMKMGNIHQNMGYLDLEDGLKGIAFNWLSLMTYIKMKSGENSGKETTERYNAPVL